MAVLRRRESPRYIIGVVSGAHLLSHVYLLAFPPLFPLLAREFGLSTTKLGLLVTAVYVPTLLFQLPLGDLVDRVGARRVLVTGIVITALGITLGGFAVNYPMLLACAFISGIGQSVFHPADYALLDTVTDSTTEGAAFSLHTFGGFVGFAAAPVLVGGLGLARSWEVALIAVGILGFGYAVGLHLTTTAIHTRTVNVEDSDHPESTRGSDGSLRDTIVSLVVFARRFKMMLVFSFYFLSMMAFAGLQSFTTVLGVSTFGFDESTANTLLTIHLMATAVGVISGGVLADRLPFRTILPVLFSLSAICVWMLVLFEISSLIVTGLLLSLIGLLIGLALPARDKFANTVADPGTTGKSFGFFFTGLSLGAVVGPTFFGAVIDYFSVTAAFIIVGGFLVASVAVVLVARFTRVGISDSETVVTND